MARIVRTHWLSAVLSLLIVAAGGTGVLMSPAWHAGAGGARAGAVAAAAPEPPPALDAVSHARVRELRESLCLTAQDLAAMGCDKAAAGRVLGGLIAWQQANRAQVEEARRSERAAQARLREAYTKMHVGPADAGAVAQIPVLTGQLEAARQRRRQVAEGAAAAVAAHLAPAQAQVWAAARANAAREGAGGPLRYAPDLTAGQLKDLRSGKEAEQSLWGTQRLAVAAARANLREHSQGVLEAQNELLPPPVGIGTR